MANNTHPVNAETVPLKILFVVNPGSGNGNIDWKQEINNYFDGSPHVAEQFELPNPCNKQEITDKIISFKPDRVVATGGDGTVKLVAECIPEQHILLGILPAGSANGLAKELGIPSTPKEALDVATGNFSQTIHLVKVNNEICIHLSDIGFNAYVVKKFDQLEHRGMWGYIKAAWKVLWQHDKMELSIQVDDNYIRREAAMVVIANATRYGSGALINPAGRLNDDLFEVVVVKKISFAEIFKMMVTHRPYDKTKTELFQTRELTIRTKKKVHFQVDGEYLGKVKTVQAKLLPQAIKIALPEQES
ncbi:MAG: diacylglycerol/lipid kinase family protein [Agriterribacter sp.]